MTSAAARLPNLLREPLVQFLLAAALLFSLHGLLSEPDPAGGNTAIVIPEGRVRQIAESYEMLAGRLPSRAETQALVDDYVEEEIAYREALAMGLDVDDTIVRRRMRQKLLFLAEDAGAGEEPDEATLRDFHVRHRADYLEPRRLGFRQVLASRDRRGPATRDDAAALVERLRAGAEPEGLGDASLLPGSLAPQTEERVSVLFGDDFAAALFGHEGEGWFGPIASPFGAHAVEVTSRVPAREPAFAEIEERLRSDWTTAQREAAREDYLAQLRERYEVEIDWPAQEGPAAAPADSD